MAAFQFFSPFTRDIGTIRSIEFHSAACETDLSCADYVHSIRALPAIVGVHALAFLRGDETEYASELLLRISREAIDPSLKPNRETLEILWQSALAALIRNPHNWQHLYFSPPVVAQWEEVCIRFLNGESVLFYAAVAVYQLMLTYERALRARNSELARRSASTLQKAFEKISRYSGSPSFAWLQRLSALYEDRNSYQRMIPQQSEVALGLAAFEKDVAEYFLLTRFYGSYVNYRTRTGAIVSPYTSNSRTANNPNVCALIFGLNRGFAFDVWQAIRQSQVADLLDESARKYVDDRFSKTSEQRDSDRLALPAKKLTLPLLPFKQSEEIVVYDSFFTARDASRYLQSSSSVDAERLVDQGLSIARSFAKKFGAAPDKLTNRELKKVIFEQLPDDTLVGPMRVLDEFRNPPSRRPFVADRVEPRMEGNSQSEVVLPRLLVCAFAFGLLVGVIGLASYVVALVIDNNIISIVGAAGLTFGWFLAALCILCGRSISAAGGIAKDELPAPSS
jgi:hypothetical protein